MRLINYLASYNRINDFGFLEAPYAKVVNGVSQKSLYDRRGREVQDHHAAVSRTRRKLIAHA